MAFGTLKADTLTHSTEGSVNTKFAVSGSAKAWIQHDATNSDAIGDSLNYSSLLDNGTGDYTYTVASAFSNANYALSQFSQQDTAGGLRCGSGKGTPTTTDRRIDWKKQAASSTTNSDNSHNQLTWHGELA
jgi:hypothetical protein